MNLFKDRGSFSKPEDGGPSFLDPGLIVLQGP